MSTPLSEMINSAYTETRPISAQLELTYRCNLLCSFCYNAPKKRPQLDSEQWSEAIDKLRAAGTFNVTLTGGEPFRHPDFFEIAGAVRARGLVLKTYTNGVDLAKAATAERYAALAPFDTEISVHGPTAQIHDRLTGVAGSFDKLLTALGHLQRLGVKVSLKTPITRLNQAVLPQIEALAARFDDTVTFDTNIVPTDDGFKGTLDLAPERSFLVDFFVDQVRRGKRGLDPRPVEKMKQVCGVGRTAITIDPYGDIFPCVAWRRPVANIMEIDNLLTLWQGAPGSNETLDYVRGVADAAAQRTLVGDPAGAFASFCPASAEKETGDPFTFYSAARISGQTKLEAFRRLQRESKPGARARDDNK